MTTICLTPVVFRIVRYGLGVLSLCPSKVGFVRAHHVLKGLKFREARPSAAFWPGGTAMRVGRKGYGPRVWEVVRCVLGARAV